MVNELESIKPYLKQARKLVTEIDLNQVNSKSLLRQTRFQTKQNINQIYSKAELSLISSKLNQVGLDIKLLKQYKPWFIALQFINLQAINQGYQFENSVDELLTRYANAHAIPVSGLEAASDQLELLDKQAVQGKAMLLDTLAQADKPEFQINYIANAWTDGDLNQLATLNHMSNGYPSYEYFEQTLLIQRNKNWRDLLMTDLEQGKIFIAVGLMHMTGEQSLLRLLDQKNVTIKRLQ